MIRLCSLILFLLLVSPLHAATLKIGVARGDITPPKSVPLWGQFNLRLSQGVESPLMVNVVALESADREKRLDSAIFVCLDLCIVTADLLHAVQEKVADKVSSIDVTKLVVNATHTHSAPTLSLDHPKLPVSDQIMDYPEAIDFTAERIAIAIAEAWQSRKPGKIAFGLDFGIVTWNRRAAYADGRSVMLGNTNQPDFRGMESMEDHDIGSLFFMDEHEHVLAVAVNVASPSQIVGANIAVSPSFWQISADFWHPVRQTLMKRFGKDLVVLGWCGAAGDNCPYPMYQRATIERMNTLRELDEMQSIARTIDRAVSETWDAVRTTATGEVTLAHRVETLQLPMRTVSEQEYQSAKAECERISAAVKANPDKAPAEIDWMAGGWHGKVVRHYEALQNNPDSRYVAGIRVIQLGEMVIFTNPFEMFTDYGVQMKARSPAVQTFVIQLVGDAPTSSYLATERAVQGGGYSAVIQSAPVSPEGGQILVEETLKIADGLFVKEL